MTEENKETSKNKWSRIFRKKWFFPAVYLLVAALLLTVVVWYQNLDNQLADEVEEEELSDNFRSDARGEDAKAVLDQQEVIMMPIAEEDEAEIVTKFYDYTADEESQQEGLVLYNNRYYQSKGIDIKTAEEEDFDVIASLSGEVKEVKEDPLLGNVVVLTHENDVLTYYASLKEVDVKAGSKIEQGDKLGTAGQNIFGKDNGTHVHFQIRKDSKEVNPEDFFNQPVTKLDEAVESNEEEADVMPEKEEESSDIGDVELDEDEAQDQEKKEEEKEEADEKKDQDEMNNEGSIR